MRPKQRETSKSDDLFRARLDQIINPEHELLRLAAKIDWTWIDGEIAPLYSEHGRPAVPTRFMIGLLLLKHIYALSDEDVCERWVENPYFQFFTGEEFFQHTFPHERSGLSHWRKRLGDKLGLLLAESLRVAHTSGALRPRDLIRAQQQRQRGWKLYSFHAPEVECIGKGKARSPYEFGIKVSIVATNRCAPAGQFVLHAQSLPGNPYDGHTLNDAIEGAQRLTGLQIERAYVDKGYRGHDAPDPRSMTLAAVSMTALAVRSATLFAGVIKRELRRRSAIEPLIGHMKEEGHLGRCYLKGHAGDAANAILTAVGHNFRRILAWLRNLLRSIFHALLTVLIDQQTFNRAC